MLHYVPIENKGYNDMNPMLFGYQKCNSGHFFGPAVRTYWLIHYVVSGFGVFKINDKEYYIGPGEMFVISPFTETYYRADEKNPWTYIWIGFTSEMENLPLKLTDVVRCPEAYDVFNSMKKCEKMENGKTAFLTAKIWELFAILMESGKEENDHIRKALNLIHGMYMTDISVELLADKINLERTYFSTLFKKKVGVSPGKYIFNYRMSVAASLMVNNKKSVSIAAASVGYGDIFNFSKMFKKHYGVSPKEYIKLNSKP